MTERQSTDYVAMGKDMRLESKELAKFIKEQLDAERLILEQRRNEKLEIDKWHHQEKAEERQCAAEERQHGAKAQR